MSEDPLVLIFQIGTGFAVLGIIITYILSKITYR